jgi:hypothetical protein
MEIQSTINFLVGAILSSFAFLAFAVTIVVINNLFAKYWKPVKWQVFDHRDIQIVDREVIEELKDSMAKQKLERNKNVNS